MDALSEIAQWMRATIAAQTWLSSLGPYLSQQPDWVLLAAAAALLLLLLLLLWTAIAFWAKVKRRRPAAARAERVGQERSARAVGTDGRKTAIAASPTPPVPRKTRSSTRDANRSVRVFISSTFKDMQGERDELLRKTFPALHARFRARGVELLAVDLRWGITQEQAQSGKTLPTLMAEIDRCRPYFIGLLGERYGWVPPDAAITPELKAAYPFLAEASGCSITELEMMHGVLLNPDRAARAVFFQRNSAYLNELDPEERARYAGDNEGALANLKQRIRDSGAKIVPYDRPGEIGTAVEAEIAAWIEDQFPEADAPDEFQRAASLHAAFARERCGVYVGGEHYLSLLDAWISRSDAERMLVVGASGAGKSTLIANWLAQHRERAPRDIIFEHYLGASPDSAEPVLLIRRLWEHLNRVTGEAVGIPEEEREVRSGLPQRLARAGEFAERRGVNIVLALDGLDKLSREQDLGWLPASLPKRVRLLASALDGPARRAVEALGAVVLDVEPFGAQDRHLYVDQDLRAWGRSLSPERTRRIVECPLSGAPLFLKTLLNELRVAGVEAKLDAQLDSYLTAQSIPDLFNFILKRLEVDCGQDFVRLALSLIWASRAGLEEGEILWITKASPLDWATLRNQLADALRDQDGRMTFSHDFLRQAVEARYLASREARASIHLVLADHFEGRGLDLRQAEELPFHLREAQAWDRLEALLTDLDRLMLLRMRGDGELLSHWLALQERGRNAEELLCQAFESRVGPPDTWMAFHVDLAFSIIRFLKFAEAHGASSVRLMEMCAAACEALRGEEDAVTLASISNLALALSARGEFEDARALLEHVLAVRTRVYGEDNPDTHMSAQNLASTLSRTGDYARTLELQERSLAEEIRILGPEHPSTLTSKSNLATTLYNLGDLAGARKLQEEVVSAETRQLGAEHPSTLSSMGNLASILAAQGDRRGALKLEERVVEASIRVLGPRHSDTLISMNNLAMSLAANGDLERAQAYCERVAEAMTAQLGADHPSTRQSIENLADIRDRIALGQR